jgi:Flp pilus assembly protein CpaB
VAALGLVVLIVLYRNQQPRQDLVLRVARDVPAGAVLTAGDLQPVAESVSDDLAATLVPAGEQAELLGRRVGSPLTAGEFLSRGQLGSTPRGIASGQRLVAIPVDTDTVSGLALSRGDVVEITATTGKTGATGPVSQVVVPTATVYEVGPQDTTSGVLGAAQKTATSSGRQTWISLVVDQGQVQAIGEARSTGDLYLAVVPEADAP